MRSQFTFYGSFFDALRRIKKKADRADAYDSICKYALYGETPDLDKMSDAASIAFVLIKPILDSSAKKAESGKKGGQAQQPDSKAKANDKQTESKRKQRRSEAETETEKEKEKEVEVEVEVEKEVENEKESYITPKDATTPETTEPESTETVSLELSGVVAQLKPYCRSQDWGKNSTLRVQRWLESGAELEMLDYAFDIALSEGADKVFGYASAIIDRWLLSDIRTKNEAIEYDRKWHKLDSETRRRLTSDHTRTFFPNDEESSELPF